MKTRVRVALVAVAAALAAMFVAALAAPKGHEPPAWTGKIAWTVGGPQEDYPYGSGAMHGEIWINPDGTCFADVELHAVKTGPDPLTRRIFVVTYAGSFRGTYDEPAPGVSMGAAGNWGLALQGPRFTAKVTNTNPENKLPPEVPVVTGPYLIGGGDAKPDTNVLVGCQVTYSGTRALGHYGPFPCDSPAIKGGVRLTVSWNLVRDLQLVVEIPNYEQWIPEGGKKESERGGDLLRVKARLQTRDGQPSPVKAGKIVFQLVHVSHQPGVCMNYPPLDSADKNPPEPDLQFAKQDNPALDIYDESDLRAEQGVKAETPPGDQKYSEAEANVGSYDYGAFAELRVKAVLPGGAEIYGYLEGDKSRPSILLPRRKPDSLIADAWKAHYPQIKDRPDDEDDDGDPHGGHAGQDGFHTTPGCDHRGDGLTLYEEYRGFFVNGKHIRTDPTVKDVFILDRLQGSSKAGIALFQGITGLAVHDLREDEVCLRGAHHFVTANVDQPEVVVNADRDGQTPQLAPKYAILLWGAGLPDQWVGNGEGPDKAEPTGNPKLVTIDPAKLEGPKRWREWRDGSSVLVKDRYPGVVAHELLHGCNVRHHGDFDVTDVRWIRGADPDSIEEVLLNGDFILQWAKLGWNSGPHPIQVKWDYSDHVVGATELDAYLHQAGLSLPLDLYVASKGGQHSGCLDCVMRYSCAQAYMSPPGSAGGDEAIDSIRYLVRGDAPGSVGKEWTPGSLCDLKDDPAAPGATGRPFPDRGAATAGCCRSQICVNDAWRQRLAKKKGAGP